MSFSRSHYNNTSSREEVLNCSDTECVQEDVMLSLTTCGAASYSDVKQVWGGKYIYMSLHVNLWILVVFLLAWMLADSFLKLLVEQPWSLGCCSLLSPPFHLGAGGSSYPACTQPLPCRKDVLCTFSQKLSLGMWNTPNCAFCKFSTREGWCGRIGENSGYSVPACCMPS